jgi:ribosomal protein S20
MSAAAVRSACERQREDTTAVRMIDSDGTLSPAHHHLDTAAHGVIKKNTVKRKTSARALVTTTP